MKPTERLAQINSYRRRQTIVLDYIAQMRLRAQVAESYGLAAVAARCRASIDKLELDLERYSTALNRLSTE